MITLLSQADFMRTRTGLAVLLTLGLGLGCGAESPVDPPADPGDPGDAVAASITLDRAALTFGAVGSFADLVATVRDAEGSVILDASLTWSMAGTGVARVNGSGRVTALGNGTDTVTVGTGSVTSSAVVRVAQVPVGVAVAASATTLRYAGAEATLTASVVDSNGVEVDASAVVWSSSNPDVAPVDGNGRVVALRDGSAEIVATSGTMSGATTMSVVIEGPVGGAITGTALPCGAQNRAGPFTCTGMELLAYLPVAAVGGAADIEMSDLWGWTDSLTGKDYAIVTRTDGTAFVDVSDPVNPLYLGYLPLTPGAPIRFWHDVKVYGDHAFIVADAAGSYGVQIFDLTELRTVDGSRPERFDPTARYDGIASSHNIAINEQTGFAYVVGANGGGNTCGGGLHMIDVSVPASPTFAGCFADPLTGNAGTGYTHDVQCAVYAGPDPDHQGREICLGSNETHLSIADVTDKTNPVALSRATYPGVGYAHQGWLSEDQRYFFTNDELDELSGAAASTRTLIWDVTDLDDPVLAAQYAGPSAAIDHNHYVNGTRLYMSNYQYGIRVVDITDPENPQQVAHFDTAPTAPDVPGFGGSWSNYPFFDSGIIVATSAAEGVFVMRLVP